VRPATDLVRVAAGPGGVAVGRHLAGRGAWLCGPACLEQSLRRKALPRALRTTITEPELIQLRESFERTAARMTESAADESIVAPTPTKG
jgi:predicted RNA-binding protein YlxR (DUF448 family)